LCVCNLDHADNIALIKTSQMGMQQLTEVEKISGRVRLRTKAGKCEVVISNDWE